MFLASDPTTITGWFGLGTAIVGVFGTVMVAMLTRDNRKATRAIHEEVRTNHGMRAGEYIERLASMELSIDIIAAGQKELLGKMATRAQLEMHADDDLAFQRRILAQLEGRN